MEIVLILAGAVICVFAGVALMSMLVGHELRKGNIEKLKRWFDINSNGGT